MAWPGQFNFDFAMFLLLSAAWTAWHNNFTLTAFGLALALAAAFAEMLFLSAYLLYLSVTTKGDIVAILLGNRRASNRQN